MKTLRLVALLVAIAVSSGCVGLSLGDVLNTPPLSEQELSRKGFFSDGKVLVIDISGEIASRQTAIFSKQMTPDSVTRILRLARQDDAIKAVVLRVDTPGGEVTASDLIYKELLEFKKAKRVPVYASILSLGCSGGYYISAAADKIFAHPTSVVGSIGVIGRVPQVRKLADKIGYDEVVIKSGPMKDMGNPLRTLDEEQRRIFQGIIDDMYKKFLDVVVLSRAAFKDHEDLRPIADGRVYTASQAKGVGLVDDIKYLQDVIDEAAIAGGMVKPKVVRYLRGAQPTSSIYTRTPGVNVVKMDLGGILAVPQPGFYYLWLPGR